MTHNAWHFARNAKDYLHILTGGELLLLHVDLMPNGTASVVDKTTDRDVHATLFKVEQLSF